MSQRVSYYLTHEDQLIIVRPGETPPTGCVQLILLDTLRTIAKGYFNKSKKLANTPADHYGYKEQAAVYYKVSEEIDQLRDERSRDHELRCRLCNQYVEMDTRSGLYRANNDVMAPGDSCRGPHGDGIIRHII